MPRRVSIAHHDGNEYSNESSEDYNDPFGPFPDEEEDNAIEHFPHEEDSHEEDNSDDEVHNPTVVEDSWKVNHNNVTYTYPVKEFMKKVFQPSFDSAAAIQMLHKRCSIDFGSNGSRGHGGRAVKSSDQIYTEFFLDFLSIIGRPGEAISKLDCPLLESIPMSFSNWAEPYAAKHSSGIDFNLTGRTFRLAKTDKRETWFIVMHPKPAFTSEDPRPHRKLKQGLAADSGMLKERATCLAAYITATFNDPMLIGHGVERCWRPGSKHSQTLPYTVWAVFQDRFMRGWSAWSQRQSGDSFWTTNEPAFHCYCYGQNQPIVMSAPLIQQLEELEEETYERPSGADEDSSSECSDEDDSTESHEEISGSDEDDSTSSQRQTDGVPSRRTSHASSGDESHRHRRRGRRAACLAAQDRLISQTDSIQILEGNLSSHYNIDRIGTVSYALAACVHSTTENGALRCLLGNRNQIASHYVGLGSRAFTFYSQAFHPVYGNFSSNSPPDFLDPLLTALRVNMASDVGGDDVLSFGYFQGYSNIKRAVRHSAEALLATKGYATAGLTCPKANATCNAVIRRRRENALSVIVGGRTPNKPTDSKPFARENRQIQDIIEQGEAPYRLEQVVSIDLRRVTPDCRSFRLVVRPIIQLMRFFLCERKAFTPIFWSMPIAVFPGIMCAYSRLFELALDEMHRRFDAGGKVGLNVANSEAVAVLDRLGGYIFTGSDRHLPERVLRPLGTVESIRLRAWPFIDPAKLNMHRGTINMQTWPTSSETGRPMLLHVDELRYHYGAVVAESRESELWLAHLSDDGIRNTSQMSAFVAELVEKRWVPETRYFMAQQLRKRVSQSKPGGAHLSSDAISAGAQAIAAWEEESYPFRMEALKRLKKGLEPSAARVRIREETKRTRHDHAHHLIHSVREGKAGAHACKASTWPKTLHNILLKWCHVHARYQGDRAVDDCEPMWALMLISSMQTLGIEWVPGSANGRIVSTAIVELQNDKSAAQRIQRIPLAQVGTSEHLVEVSQIRRESTLQMQAAANHEVSSFIDFRCRYPFKEIPPLIQRGFDNPFSLDEQIRAHYELARLTLSANIAHPSCQLMLMLILTICSSTETPQVCPNHRHFSAPPGPHKDDAQLAVVLATRMLWFLFPNNFPKEDQLQESPAPYNIKEMTKKIEHKGVNNRMIRELDWVIVRGNRPTPRNSEMIIKPAHILEARMKALESAMGRPSEFIAMIFKSREQIWVQRCESIIHTEPVPGGALS
ncbi:hypothetical protein E4U38_007652 [Claviceps purpurea]|nr:hypothetical protein E4U38_007652 [Claviceps purpurea]KAG6178291.1 hypothetical protein E4U10_008274 [Claviceps purpurea]KAG6230979.1 hypothetical protein E4U25_007098 [Claviceps purpurea]